MIKVSLLIPTLDQSGAEKQLTLLATSLPRDEFDVQVIALTRDWCNLQEDYYCDGYTVWYICFVAVFVGSLWAVAVVSHARAFAALL